MRESLGEETRGRNESEGTVAVPAEARAVLRSASSSTDPLPAVGGIRVRAYLLRPERW